MTEYDLGWHSPNHNGTIYLQRDGGSYQQSLKLAGDSLEIDEEIDNWEEHIARGRCSFTIINNLADFYELMPLMTISAGQIKVVVTNDSYASAPRIIFEGYLNCEAVDQDMLYFADLTLTASGLLSKLQYAHPPSVDTLQFMTLIDIIDDCLVLTGSSYPIYVNCSLYEINAALGTRQTLFNRTALYTELFWENNIERMSALEILEAILKSFNCYLHWYGQKWYIKHYEDLNSSGAYVIYESGVSAGYGYSDQTDEQQVFTPVPRPIFDDVYGTNQIGGSQQLTVIPGLQRLDIKLDQRPFYNLLNPDLATSEDTVTAEPLLNRREWLSYEDAGPDQWSGRGSSFKDIDNAIERFNYDIAGGSLQMNGLTTRFTASTNGFDTELVITFKWAPQNLSLLASWMGDSQFDNNPEQTSITFYWYLCTYEAVIANRDFFWLNPATEDWEYVVDGDAQTNFNILEITAADLDKDFLTFTGTFKIPIGLLASDSSGDIEDLDLVFRMGTEEVDKAGEAAAPASKCYYGDFRASISGQPEDNLLRGDITTDFLDKRTIELALFDSGWNYRNGLVRPTSWNYLTDLWSYGGSDDTGTLAEILMKSKFRLYRIARQKITMIVHDPTFPRWPLVSPFVDSKQSNKIFIMLKHIYRPQSDEREVILYEYDDTEEINLV